MIGRLTAFTSCLHRLLILAAASLLSLTLSHPVNAAEPLPTTDLGGKSFAGPRPWAENVSVEHQDLAEKLFLEGNRLFSESFFKTASQKYREALKHWDHPSIHYNLALSLNNLDDPIEAYRHLVEALKYDGAPLDDKRREEASRHLKATQRQVSTLEVACKEPGAVVLLDGRELMTGPNRSSSLLIPGRHLVSVRKPGYLSREYPLTLVPGEPQRVDVRIYTQDQLVDELPRSMPFWLPVAITGTGVAMVATGAVLGTHSNNLIEQLNSEVNRNNQCKQVDGCRLTPVQRDAQDESKAYKTWATVSIVAGAATITGGAVMMWFNRTRTRQYTPEERERQTTVAPIIGSNMLGAMALGRF